MADHDIDAQDIRGLDHIHAAGPETGPRTLPEIPAIQGQRLVPAPGLFAQAVHEGLHMGESPHATIVLRYFVILQIGVGVGLGAVFFQSHRGQQFPAHQMGQTAIGVSHAQIHVRLAEEHRQQLTMPIGGVQNANVARHGHIVVIVRQGKTAAGGPLRRSGIVIAV